VQLVENYTQEGQKDDEFTRAVMLRHGTA